MNEELTDLISALDEWGNKNGNRYLLFAYKEEDNAVSFAKDEKSRHLTTALADMMLHDDELYDIIGRAHDLARVSRKWNDKHDNLKEI